MKMSCGIISFNYFVRVGFFCALITAPAMGASSSYLGTWVTPDRENAEITRIEISSFKGSINVRTFAKCDPEDCDWGVASIPDTTGSFDVRYDFKSETVTLSLEVQKNGSLRAFHRHVYDGIGRPHEIEEFLVRESSLLADLVISDISIPTTMVEWKAEPWTWVSFTVRNDGTAPMTADELLAQKVNVTRDGEPVELSGFLRVEDYAFSLLPGEDVSHSFAVGHNDFWKPGSYAMQIKVDHEDSIDESNEQNNLSDVLEFTVYECYPDLPTPHLVLDGIYDTTEGGVYHVDSGYQFHVANAESFPDALFERMSGETLCGFDSSRVAASFRDQDGVLIERDCSIFSSSDLSGSIGFILYTKPESVYLELYDRQCGQYILSNHVPILGQNAFSSVVMDPVSPSKMLHSERVNLTFDYETVESEGVRIRAVAYSNGVFPEGLLGNTSGVYTDKIGSGTGFIRVSYDDVTVDQIKLLMYNHDWSILLHEESFDVEYQYGNSVSASGFTPESPAMLHLGEYVYVDVDYAVSSAEGAVIVATPRSSSGALLNHSTLSHTVTEPTKGSCQLGFTIEQEDALVDLVDVTIYKPDMLEVYQEITIDVEYYFGNSISNISMTPPSPDVLEHDEKVNITFDYFSDTEEDVLLFIQPHTDGSKTPESVFSGSSNMPVGNGSVTRFFYLRSGNGKVEEVRVWMANAEQTEVLAEVFVPVEYLYGTAVGKISMSPAGPVILQHGEDVTVTFSYVNSTEEEVLLFAEPYSNGSVSPRSASSSSLPIAPGKGTLDRTFHVFSGDTTVDQVRLVMYDLDKTEIFAETFVSAEYHYGVCPAGDLDVHCDVNMLDFAMMASAWHMSSGDPEWDEKYDLHPDGQVNLLDLKVIGENWLAGTD